MILSPVERIGEPGDRKGYVATVATCGPFLILSSCKALGTPEWQGLRSHCAHMWAISDIVLVQSIGVPRDGRSSLATVPTCGPFLNLSPAQSIGAP